MKRVQLLVLALAAVLSARAAVNYSAPDFAYPQKVDKNARKDLNTAIEADDAKAALNALMRVFISNHLIGAEGGDQQSIELAESTARKFANSPLAGMFDALIANMYYTEYSSDSWIYNEREMPLTPRPADIDEWSGEQYRFVIDSLLDQSIASPSALSALHISDYADIVEANKLTQTYYPTLYDFVCANAFVIGQKHEKYIDAALASARERGSLPAEILWQTEAINLQPYSKRHTMYKDLYLSYKDSEYSSLPLSYYVQDISPSSPDEIDEAAWAIGQVDSMLKRWPTGPLADKLKNIRSWMERKSVSIKHNIECMPGQPLTLSIENCNTDNYTINIYRVDGKNDYISANELRKLRPLQSIKMSCAETTPFIKYDTIEATLDRQGYYVIAATSSDFKDYSVSTVHCFDILPVGFCTNANSWLAVVNPQTGAPIADAGVSYIAKPKGNKPLKRFSFTPTNSFGLTDISKLKGQIGWQSDTLLVTYNGKTTRFDEDYIFFPNESYGNSGLNGSLLTDRAIYHPGDSVHYLLIAYQEGELAKDMAVDLYLCDANGETIDTATVKTDEWGRAYGAFAIPASGLTGRFDISCDFAYKYFMVSDYRMPEFELTDVKVARDVPSKGEVTVTGRAVYYSGMPMAGATVTGDLQECQWRWRPMPSGLVASLQATTGDNGEFSITYSASSLTSKNPYSVSLSAVSPSGSNASASPVTFSLGKQYVINLDVGTVVDGEKPFSPKCKLTSYSGENVEFDIKWTLSTMDSVVVLSGNSLKNIDLSSVNPADYIFTVEPVDTALADAAGRHCLIYNVASGIVPETNDVIWMPERSVTVVPGKQGELLIGLTDSAYIYSGVVTTDGFAPTGRWYSKGYHKIKVDAVEGNFMLATIKDFHTTYNTISIEFEPEKPMQIIGETFRDKLIPGQPETWRLRVVDGEGRGVSAALALDMYNHALDALIEHSFSPYLAVIKSNARVSVCTFARGWDRIDSYYSYPPRTKYEELDAPQFSLWEYLHYSRSRMYKSIMIRGTRNMAMNDSIEAEEELDDDEYEVEEVGYDSVAFEPCMSVNVTSGFGVSDELLECEVVNAYAYVEYDGKAESIQMRDGDVSLAVWAPELTTDADGNVCYTFTVPNANASWRLYATAWTQSLNLANLSRDFIANKPLMVQPNAPRFLRAGDKADVAIALLNNTDSLATVQAVVELFDPATGKVFDTRTGACEIDSLAQSTIFVRIEASSTQTAIGLRVKAFTSQFGDGEQLVIPVLPADASLIETTPFYLNPGDTTFTMTLPAQPDARISLAYCENPAWTIVSALPGLREDKGKYANSAAAAIFSAAISQGIIRDNPEIAAAIAAWQANPADSALVSMLEKNEDLKIAMLNATPWVQAAQSDSERMARLALLFDKKQTSQTISNAIDVLQQLQRPDGGWAWGDWCQQSSPWVTSNVLSMMAELKSYGWMPSDKRLGAMIKSALKYWDKEVEGPNMAYAIVRKRFADMPVSTHGQQAITKTVNDILKHWKSYSDPAIKALAAEALYLNGYPTKSRELMSSITEFGVWSESQGLRFPSVNSLSSYASILSAYAMIEPGSRQVDGLRQQLIVRKQATDWGSSVVTSEVVAAILSSGTRWTVPAQGVDITVGGQPVAIDGAVETATGSLRANLSAHAGETLAIAASTAGPSYGAVYSQFDQAMADVKAAACDDLSIEKTMMVRRGSEWEYVNGPLRVGDRVKVQLTIHSRRNMQYVAIIDERPAAFEPVDQLPGWMWSQGAGFYRENRDSYTTMHIVSLVPGTYQLAYEMNVSTAGAFASGVATIQSQYAPELSAHSAGMAIEVQPQ